MIVQPRRSLEQLRADLERRRSSAASPVRHRTINRSNRTRRAAKRSAIAEQR